MDNKPSGRWTRAPLALSHNLFILRAYKERFGAKNPISMTIMGSSDFAAIKGTIAGIVMLGKSVGLSEW